MRNVLAMVRRRWCYMMHPAPMWPINGYYVCPRCQERFRVQWEGGDSYAPEPIQASSSTERTHRHEACKQAA